MKNAAIVCLVLVLAAGGLCAWGMASGASACYAGILGAAIVASLFASALKWWKPRDASGSGEGPSPALSFDPRGKNPRTYVLNFLASAPCKVVIQVMTIALVLGFAVSKWLAVTLGFTALLVALGVVMAGIWYFNVASVSPAPSVLAEDDKSGGTPPDEGHDQT